MFTHPQIAFFILGAIACFICFLVTRRSIAHIICSVFFLALALLLLTNTAGIISRKELSFSPARHSSSRFHLSVVDDPLLFWSCILIQAAFVVALLALAKKAYVSRHSDAA